MLLNFHSLFNINQAVVTFQNNLLFNQNFNLKNNNEYIVGMRTMKEI